MEKKQVRNLVLSGLFLALGLVLPLLTGQIPAIGSRLLPMHLPVLLCGFLCGWPWGLAVGVVTPLLRSLIFGMPPMMPTAVAMAFELAAYGAVAGVAMRFLPRNFWGVLGALIIAMLAGRIVWGIVSLILYTLMGSSFGWQLFFAGAFVNAVPGIIAQLLLVPAIVMALWRVERQAVTA